MEPAIKGDITNALVSGAFVGVIIGAATGLIHFLGSFFTFSIPGMLLAAIVMIGSAAVSMIGGLVIGLIGGVVAGGTAK